MTLATAYLIIPQSRLPLAATLYTHWAKRELSSALTQARLQFDEGVPLSPLLDDLLLVTRLLLVAAAVSTQTDTWKNSEYSVLIPLVGTFSTSELHDLALCLIERRRDVRMGLDALFALELVSVVACERLFGRQGMNVSGYAPTPIVVAAPSIVPPVTSAPVVPSVPVTPSMPVASTSPPTSVSAVAPSAIELSVPVPQTTSIPVATGDLTLDVIRAKWSSVVALVDEQNHSLPFVLKISRPDAFDADCITIRFQYAFHRDKIITDPRNRRIVEEALTKVFGRPLRIDGMIGDEATSEGAAKGDMVSTLLKAFGGNVVE